MQRTTNAKFLLALLMITACFISIGSAQDRDIREDRASDRVEYERAMLVNPKTGRIPDDIHRKSLEFIYSPKSHLQPRFHKSSRAGVLAAGTQWVQRGPYNVGGRTRALAIDKMDENIILAGGVSGGMWRSNNGGASWTKVTGASQNHSVTAIAQDPQNPTTWYYSAGEGSGNSASASFSAPFVGNGIYKSTDNGLTWVLLNSTASGENETDNPFRITWNIQVHPTNGDIYVANARQYANGQSGIWRSTDGGTTWQVVLDGGSAVYSDVVVDAQGVLYATISSTGTNEGIFRSVDGINWININPGFLPTTYNRIVMDVAPSNQNVVYFFAAASGGPNGHSFYKYTYTPGQGNGDGTDGNGGTWEDRSTNLPAGGGTTAGGLTQVNYNQYVKVKPDDENVVFIGSTNMYRSTDGFASTGNSTWIGGYHTTNFFYPGHHPDNHSLVFFASNPNRMISGHDGGVSITEDNMAVGGVHPVDWTYLNNGYYTTQVYGMDIDPKTAGDPRLSAGFQDNGKWTTHSFSGTSPWKQENFFGDGAYTAIVPGQDIRFFSNQNGFMFRVTGNDPENPTSAVLLRPNAFGFLFVTPYILDPNDSNTMYFLAGANIYRNNNILYTNTLDSWERLSTANVGATITAISASEDNPKHRVYYGTNNGRVYRLDNAKTGDPVRTDVWTGKGFPVGAYVSNIAIDPTDANKVFVVFSNYGIQSVFYSEDAGANWTHVSGNLEENQDGTGNGPSTRWMRVHVKADGSKVYLIGTSVGLYSTNQINGAATDWMQEGTSAIGNVPVVMIKSRTSDGLVALGTHGTGLFSGYIGAPTTPTIANISPMNGEVNSEVVINGTMFSATPTDNVVKFNGVAATVTSANMNNLTVTVPSGATTGKITVEVNGQTLTSDEDFTVVPAIQNYPYVTSFEGGFSGWKQATDDGFDWSLTKQATPSAGTGPVKASEGNTYLYTEIDQFSQETFELEPLNQNKTARLIGPTFDLSSLNTPYVFFAYHMFGSNMGTLTLEASTDGTTWQSVWSQTGDQGNEWRVASVNIAAYKSSSTKLRFAATAGDGSGSDIAIDAITIGEEGAPAVVGFTPELALGGFTNVTVLGVNFDSLNVGNNKVFFNGVEGTISEVKATQITAKVPATATTGKITTEVNGKTGSSASPLTIIAPITTFPYAESFENGLGKWLQADNDDIDWTRNLGSTPSSDTGPSAAADGNFYVYTEATGNFDRVASLLSAPMDISTMDNPLVAFQYHMFGSNMGTLNLEISTDGTNWTTLWTQSGDQGDAWLRGGASLSAYKDSLFVLRFVGTTGSGFRSDISIDDILVQEGPSITSFTPASGRVGDLVTIQGEKFGADSTSNTVEFNGRQATIVSFTTSQIVAEVPKTATTGKITVRVNGLPAESATDFIVIPSGDIPEITEITPMAGVTGQTVTIEGSGFTASKEDNIVSFNGIEATIDSATTSLLVVTVPVNATTGKIEIINAGGQQVTSEDDFVVYCISGATNPADSRIDSVGFGDIQNVTDTACAIYSDFTNVSTKVVAGATYPLGVKAGTCGGNFSKIVKVFIDWNQDGDFDDDNELLGTSTAIVEPGVFDTLVTIPADAKLGKTRMRIVARETTLPDVVQSCDLFTWGETEDYTIEVLPTPVLKTFYPKKGVVGTPVFVLGEDLLPFPASEAYKLKFNGVASTIKFHKDFKIVTRVPAGATTGKITLEYNGVLLATTADDFEIPAPVITRFTPGKGDIGDRVSIIGQNFSFSKENVEVTFNGVTADVLFATPRFLKVRVPEGATTGKIGVNIGGQEVKSANDFIINDPKVLSFYPRRGAVGSQVIVKGRNFNSLSSVVRINGIQAEINEIDSRRMKITVPQGATTGLILVEANGKSAQSRRKFKVIAPTAPKAPARLRASLVDDQVTLNWEDPSLNAARFEIECSNTPNNEGVAKVGEVRNGSNTLVDASADITQKYYYRVRAINSVGASPYSRWVAYDPDRHDIASQLLAKNIKITPNPNTGRFNLEIKGGKATYIQVKVADVRGFIMKTLRVNGTEGVYPMDLTNLKYGTYTLWISTGSARTSVKYVKQ
ncbi:MAG TPA: hypothetical protein DCS93_37690 [Microscillaceae bacterium]|nr:hypothetical protein [Microscillaceae bacterium]